MRFKNFIVSPSEEKKLSWETAVIGQTAREFIFVPEFIEFLTGKLQWSKAAFAQRYTCTVSNTNCIFTDYSQCQSSENPSVLKMQSNWLCT